MRLLALNRGRFIGSGPLFLLPISGIAFGIPKNTQEIHNPIHKQKPRSTHIAPSKHIPSTDIKEKIPSHSKIRHVNMPYIGYSQGNKVIAQHFRLSGGMEHTHTDPAMERIHICQVVGKGDGCCMDFQLLRGRRWNLVGDKALQVEYWAEPPADPDIWSDRQWLFSLPWEAKSWIGVRR